MVQGNESSDKEKMGVQIDSAQRGQSQRKFQRCDFERGGNHVGATLRGRPNQGSHIGLPLRNPNGNNVLQRIILFAIRTRYLALAALYAIFTPKWQVPDEPAHCGHRLETDARLARNPQSGFIA